MSASKPANPDTPAVTAAQAKKAAAAQALADKRSKYIKAIHAKVRQMGLDDAAYRAMLEVRTGKTSCKDLTLAQLGGLCQHLSEQGAVKPGSAPRLPAPRVAQHTAALRYKVDALLLQIGPANPDKYVNSICQRNGWCTHIAFADAHILHKLVGALSRTLNGRATSTPKASRAAQVRR